MDKPALMEFLKEKAEEIKELGLAVRVFLFGSFARGNYTPSSDVDLLILVKSAEGSFLGRADKFLEFFDGIPFDVNIVVYTLDEFERLKETPFLRGVLREAIEL